jgi:hypothetical protein
VTIGSVDKGIISWQYINPWEKSICEPTKKLPCIKITYKSSLLKELPSTSCAFVYDPKKSNLQGCY